MLLDDFWWGVGDFICLNQDFQDLRIFRMLLDDCFLEVGDFYLSESGFSGCCWMIFGGELVIFICLNQDFQDVVG
jgi:hypothetical protein